MKVRVFATVWLIGCLCVVFGSADQADANPFGKARDYLKKRSHIPSSDDVRKTLGAPFKAIEEAGGGYDDKGAGALDTPLKRKTDVEDKQKRRQPTRNAWLFLHSNYEGFGIATVVGDEISDLSEYPLLDNGELTDADKMLSSARVCPGVKVILYSELNFKGNTLVISSNCPLFGRGWNDHARSLRVVN